MAAVEEQQQRPQAVSPSGENAAHVANQVSSKSPQKPLSNGVEKAQSESKAATNKQNTAKEAATEVREHVEEGVGKQLRGERSLSSGEADPESGSSEQAIELKNADPLAREDAPVFMSVDAAEKEREECAAASSETAEQVEEVEEVEESAEALQSTELAVEAKAHEEVAKQCDEDVAMEGDTGADTAAGRGEVVGGAKVASADVPTEKGGDGSVETPVAREAVCSKNESEVSTDATPVVSRVEAKSISLASQGSEGEASAAGNIDEDVDMNLSNASHSGGVAGERNPKENHETDTRVAEEVGLIVSTLVDNVVGVMNEMMSIDAESVTMLSSPMMPHLSADEAMELLEAHQGDDHEFKLDDGADADMEAEPTGNPEYQWFDGDDDDDEMVSLVPPSALDDAAETTDDVFGFGDVVDLTGATPNIGEKADIESDGSDDTQVIPSSSSNSSSSSASYGSASDSSSSSSSASSASEDESVGRASRKRHASASSGRRKLMKYKKQKRVRSSERESSTQRRYKRKRKIPPPVIPREFEVFDTEAADPILRGSYSVRNNRRACFVGNWGFSEEAFHNIESVSPFEYTSRARVLQSRRKDDKRPVSGKYGGFFKLRQFNGTLVKIREDQVDLQFLPMPPSDEEDGDEDMEGYESDEDDGDESAATRYTVLGKGKNRFGRFLIRGYLNPESGRLTVKRRYLE
uniref:Uncharacterized protein n=1 Tax=Phytophthora ramorum TaxID=164328 RepID=H3GFU1_PHYRM